MDFPREQHAPSRLIAVRNSVVLISAGLRRTTADPSAFSLVVPASSSEAYSRAVASTAAMNWSH